MIRANPQKIEEVLSRGVEEVIIRKHLEERLLRGERLRIKFGIDPTANILHLGHSVCLLKLREFQKLGHQVIFLIGDFTARIGDPTGRMASRMPLSEKQIKENMKNYKKQTSLILDIGKVEIRYNSEWWEKMDLKQMMLLAMKVTYGQISARADFKKRLAEDKDFTLEEFMYPVLQGYDSVALKADVEIGGTDQKFNMLMGRRVQKRYNQKPQDVITISLLEGLDGKEKMSKSLNNYITLLEEPADMYGKIMSLPDHLIGRYFELTTTLEKNEINKILKKEPNIAKAQLAKEIVKIYHGAEKAKIAEEEFNRVFRKKELPSEIPTFETKKEKYPILNLLFDAKLVSSKSEAKRLVEGGGVSINIKNQIAKIKSWKEEIKIEDGMVLQVGKRKFVKIKH